MRCPRVFGSLTYNSGSSTYTLLEDPSTTYTFNASGQLTSIADADGATETVTYGSPSPGLGNCPASAASCELVTSASGRTLTLGWSASGDTGTVTSLTDPLGRRTSYSYSSGNLATVTDPVGNVTSYSYDSSNSNPDLVHDLLSITRPNDQSGGPDAGDAFTNTYNSSGQVTSQTDQMGRTTSFNYSGMTASTLTGTVIVTDPDANETAYAYDQGALAEKTTGYGTSQAASTFYSPNPSSLLDDFIIDPDLRITAYSYDSAGNLLAKTNPFELTTTYSYNSFGEVTCESEQASYTACSSLSPPSAITAGMATITPPSSAPPEYVTYTEYDTDGNKIYQTTGDYAPGTATQPPATTYDLYNGQSVTLDSDDDSCTNTAPSSELPCATIDPDGVVTQLAYDSAGDLTSSSTPDGNSGGEVAKTTYTYDTDGEQTSTVAPDGNLPGANAGELHHDRPTYNADGEMTSVTVGGGSGHTVVPRVTTYTYDADGNRITGTSQHGIGRSRRHHLGRELGLVTHPLHCRRDPGRGRGSALDHDRQSRIAPSPRPLGRQRHLHDRRRPHVLAEHLGGQANHGLASNGPDGVASRRGGRRLRRQPGRQRSSRIAATTGTQWGQSMTAGDIYLDRRAARLGPGPRAATAGRPPRPTSITQWCRASTRPATSTSPTPATTGSKRSRRPPGTQWGQSMTDRRHLHHRRELVGTSGDSRRRGGGHLGALERSRTGFAFDAAGDLYVGDYANNRIQEVAATTRTQWGQSMTADDIYTMAGSRAGPRATAATAGRPPRPPSHSPSGVAFDSAGDLYIADYDNRPGPRGGGRVRHPVGPVHDGERHLHGGRELDWERRAHW